MKFDQTINAYLGDFQLLEVPTPEGFLRVIIRRRDDVTLQTVMAKDFNHLAQSWLEHQGYLVVAPPKDSELA